MVDLWWLSSIPTWLRKVRITPKLVNVQQAANQTSFAPSRKENQRSWFCTRIGFSVGGDGFGYFGTFGLFDVFGYFGTFGLFGVFGYFCGCLMVAVHRLTMFHVNVVRGGRLEAGLAAVTTLNRCRIWFLLSYWRRILLMTSLQFCFNHQYIFVLNVFWVSFHPCWLSLFLYMYIYGNLERLCASHPVWSQRRNFVFLRVKKIYKKCINKLLLGEKRQICLSTALQQNI